MTIAVVTGGSSGIGLATARLMLREGWKVAICGRDGNRLHSAVAGLAPPPGRLIARRCDVLDAAELEAFATDVRDAFGGCDVLVNNAGQGRVSTFADTSDEAWRAETDLKLFSVLRPLRAFLGLLEASGGGSVVNVNALLSRQPEPHMVATSAARAAALNLSRSLAVELAPKRIRVNSILLGLVDSGQWRRRFAARENPAQGWEEWSAALARSKGIPLGRLGRPEEAAEAILFLASPRSAYVTGTSIDVSGGLSRAP